MKSKAAQTKPGKLIIELVLELIQTKWHRSQCCGQKRECARVAQTKQVWNDSGGRGALAKFLGNFAKSEGFVGVAHSADTAE